MLRLAIFSARGRLGTFTGALIAFVAASVLAMAWGMQLESMLRTHPPVERYAATAAVVTGQQKVGADHDVLLTERARVNSALVTRLAAVRGVRAAIGDVSVPARLGKRTAVAHGWSSAALTPVPAERRTPAHPARRGRHRISHRARHASAPRVERANPHRDGRRRCPPPPPRLPAERHLPGRRRGDPAGRPSRARRRDRRARGSRLRHHALARRRWRRPGARPATRGARPSTQSSRGRAPH